MLYPPWSLKLALSSVIIFSLLCTFYGGVRLNSDVGNETSDLDLVAYEPRSVVVEDGVDESKLPRKYVSPCG